MQSRKLPSCMSLTESCKSQATFYQKKQPPKSCFTTEIVFIIPQHAKIQNSVVAGHGISCVVIYNTSAYCSYTAMFMLLRWGNKLPHEYILRWSEVKLAEGRGGLRSTECCHVDWQPLSSEKIQWRINKGVWSTECLKVNVKTNINLRCNYIF